MNNLLKIPMCAWTDIRLHSETRHAVKRCKHRGRICNVVNKIYV